MENTDYLSERIDLLSQRVDRLVDDMVDMKRDTLKTLTTITNVLENLTLANQLDEEWIARQVNKSSAV